MESDPLRNDPPMQYSAKAALMEPAAQPLLSSCLEFRSSVLTRKAFPSQGQIGLLWWEDQDIFAAIK